MLLIGLLVACGGDEPVSSDTAVADETDGVEDVMPDSVPDATPETTPEVIVDVPDTLGAPSFEITFTHPRCVPQRPCPYRLRHPDPTMSAELTVIVDGEGDSTVHLRRGQGSGLLPPSAVDSHDVTFVLDGAVAHFEVEVEARDWVEHEGLVASQLWAADVVHHVTGDLAINGELKISPGVNVVIAPGANVEVSGAVTVLGSPELPVGWIGAQDEPWGGLRLVGNATSSLEHVYFTGGGGDPEKHFGHSDSQPLVRIKAGTLEMSGGAIIDSEGKAFGCTLARLTLHDVLVARVDTGGELDRCALDMSQGHVSEIPDADGVAEDDDNDGIYLLGVLLDSEELPIESVIEDSVFVLGEDDGIDHNDALVRVERTWIEGFAHEGVAASVGHRIAVSDSVITGCDQGIEAGYGSPDVEVDHCLLTGNGTGLRFGDSYDWGADGTMIVTHTVSVGNEENVRNFLHSTSAPHPTGLTIACSMVDDPAWDDHSNNRPGAPTITQGCVEAEALSAPCDQAPPGPTPCP